MGLVAPHQRNRAGGQLLRQSQASKREGQLEHWRMKEVTEKDLHNVM